MICLWEPQQDCNHQTVHEINFLIMFLYAFDENFYCIEQDNSLIFEISIFFSFFFFASIDVYFSTSLSANPKARNRKLSTTYQVKSVHMIISAITAIVCLWELQQGCNHQLMYELFMSLVLSSSLFVNTMRVFVVLNEIFLPFFSLFVSASASIDVYPITPLSANLKAREGEPARYT